MEDELDNLITEIESESILENKNISITMLYNYYMSKGYVNYVCQYVSSIVINIFMTLLTIFLFYLDFGKILSCVGENCVNILSSIELGFNVSSLFLLGNLVSSCLLTLWLILHLLTVIPSLNRVNNYVHNELCVDKKEFMNMKWDDLVLKTNISDIETRVKVCKIDNVIIRLVKNNVLDLNIYLSRDVKFRIPYTSLTNWLLKLVIQMVDSRFREDNIKRVKRNSIILGLLFLLIMPFSYITVILYFVIKQGEQLHTKKDYLGPRSWTQYAKILFRKDNELPHEFDRRIYLASKPVNNYLNIFVNNHILVTVIKTISFISGGLITLLTSIALLNDSVLLNVFFNGRNLLSYLTIFATIFAFSRYFVVNPDNVMKDPKKELREMCEILNYVEEEWIDREHMHVTYDRINSFYRYRYVNFLREIVTFLLLPYMLFVIIPRNASNIVREMSNYRLL
jgi:large-conductance mechanosensitive channel